LNGEESKSLKPKFYYLILSLRVLFGFLFIFSACTKLIDIPEFQKAIMKFAILPDVYSYFASYIIPLLELIIGLLIILNFNLIVSIQAAIYILTFFTSVIVVKLVEGGDEISCGCFGTLSSDKINFFSVFRNIILIVWAAIILYAYLKPRLVLPADKKMKDRFKSILIIVCFIFFIVSNSALAIRNIELKNRIYTLIDKNLLSKGDLVKSFTAFKVDGSSEYINYSNYNRTILFIMKYGCKTCIHNTGIWNEITKRFNVGRIRVLGVSVDGINTTSKMIEEYRPKFQLAFNTTWEFNEIFKLYQIPVTVIIDSEGRIENIWKGFINTNIIEFLNKKLVKN
jgi:peroxiredoxin